MITLKDIQKVIDADYDHEQPDIPRSKAFNRKVRAFIKQEVSKYGYSLVVEKGGAYCQSSGFITDGKGKFVYFSTNDYRWEDWKRILVRTAKDEKDYRGGMNDYCDIADIGKKVLSMM